MPSSTTSGRRWGYAPETSIDLPIAEAGIRGLNERNEPVAVLPFADTVIFQHGERAPELAANVVAPRPARSPAQSVLPSPIRLPGSRSRITVTLVRADVRDPDLGVEAIVEPELYAGWGAPGDVGVREETGSRQVPVPGWCSPPPRRAWQAPELLSQAYHNVFQTLDAHGAATVAMPVLSYGAWPLEDAVRRAGVVLREVDTAVREVRLVLPAQTTSAQLRDAKQWLLDAGLDRFVPFGIPETIDLLPKLHDRILKGLVDSKLPETVELPTVAGLEHAAADSDIHS